MPIQVYLCPDHGDWELFTAFKDNVRQAQKCPYQSPPKAGNRYGVFCLKISKHIVAPIAAAIVKGGTGGGKDMHLPR